MSRPENPRVFFDISINGCPAAERIVVELFANVVPITAENFRVLCTGEKSTPEKPLHYKGTIINNIVKGFYAQVGDYSKESKDGESIYGGHFKDENFLLRHSGPGILSMAGFGKDANGSSFIITFYPFRWLDGHHVVFGKVIDGMGTLYKIEQTGTPSGKPSGVVEITDCGEIKNNAMESHEEKKNKTLIGASFSGGRVEELCDERKKQRKSRPLQITDFVEVSEDKKNNVMESDKGKKQKTFMETISGGGVEELCDERKKRRKSIRLQVTYSGEVSEGKKNNGMESDKGKKQKTLMETISGGGVEELCDERKKRRKSIRLQVTDSGEVSEDKKNNVMKSDIGKKKRSLSGDEKKRRKNPIKLK